MQYVLLVMWIVAHISAAALANDGALIGKPNDPASAMEIETTARRKSELNAGWMRLPAPARRTDDSPVDEGSAAESPFDRWTVGPPGGGR